ncbi:MAG: nucleotide exchange factor GrpE, partial [Deltaproteobacteria bacterium]
LGKGVADVLDIVRKSARAQTRIGVRIDELERKLSVGPSSSGRAGEDAAPSPRWDTLWDAMDLLDHAIDEIDPVGSADVRTGLAGVLTRLERFLDELGMTRGVARGAVPDGKVVRVVGTEDVASVPDGGIVRVVRAPVRLGDRVLREGDVITCRRTK